MQEQDNVIYYEIEKDYLLACEGIVSAEDFFSSQGFSVDTPIFLYFVNQALFKEQIVNYQSTYGYFDPKTMSVFIRSITSPFARNSEKKYFRVKLQSGVMREAYHKSVVAHEIAHLLAQHNYNQQTSAAPDLPNMGNGVQEYIAAVVQLRSMESALLKLILQQYKPEIIFDDEQEINIVLFSFDPAQYGIMAYRHFYSMTPTQQRLFLERIFSGSLDPDLNLDLDL